MFDFSVLTDHAVEIRNGIVLTLELWVAGSVMGFVLGLTLAVLQVYAGRPAYRLVAAYVAIFRGTPFLIQLFLLYYGGPSIGLMLSPIQAGAIGLTLYGSAQFVEIFRAGFQSVPHGQIEAARMSGLSHLQIVQHIQLPQMMLIILPSIVNLLVILTKETALLSVISIPDVTAVLQGIGSSTYAFSETLFALAAFYWILLECVTTLGRWAERRAGRYLAR
ncbi:amino acid ABC transporter permease [Afifella sp. H1R]|uniref:amino acid ABC transporter permease n=1 Tax=Afifella sp. H1R TaxID=2908841 RepID=UPI001F315BAE|nr:amino acid ABC transporter permease [Afifella sp. H1R]MCF1505908.1 amino acid ABC transporter permease [Afifella sp. H1R]